MGGLAEPVGPVAGFAVEVHDSENPEVVRTLDGDDAVREFAGEM